MKAYYCAKGQYERTEKKKGNDLSYYVHCAIGVFRCLLRFDMIKTGTFPLLSPMFLPPSGFPGERERERGTCHNAVSLYKRHYESRCRKNVNAFFHHF